MNEAAPRPCRECPFRRRSLPGYLGESSYDPDDFLLQAMSDEPMPCHMTVRWEAEDRERELRRSRQCAGRSIFWENQCKTSRVGGVTRLPRDLETVFQWPHEFKAHHRRPDPKS